MKNDLDNTGAYSSPVHPADILAIPEYTWPVGLMHLYPALSGPLFHPKISPSSHFPSFPPIFA